jgi:glycerol-3-phosphate acyltransferase PlsX
LTNNLVISLDGMGGDKAPQIVVEGAHLAREKYPAAKFIIYGDEAQIAPLIKKYPGLSDVTELRHTPDRVLADDKAAVALRQGRQSSMRLSIDAVANGEADCVVSAGNTGALMAIAKFALKVLPGIDRPAIATYLPTRKKGHGVVLLDLGANAECDPNNLHEFAVLGSLFSREIFKIQRPKIGLLNIGSEAMKGSELVKMTSELFASSSFPGEYVGYAEGDDIASGNFDVIVTDGFTGNVTLKAIEGTAKLIKSMLVSGFKDSWAFKIFGVLLLPGLLLCLPALKAMYKRIDPRYYNGASLLGLKGLCIKSHGGTDAVGFSNAIIVAAGLVESKFIQKVESELQAAGLKQKTAEAV